MDKNLARKIQDRHRKKNGLIQLWNYQRKKKIESYRHHLVEAGTQYNSKKWKWQCQSVSATNRFYVRPLARFMAMRAEREN